MLLQVDLAGIGDHQQLAVTNQPSATPGDHRDERVLCDFGLIQNAVEGFLLSARKRELSDAEGEMLAHSAQQLADSLSPAFVSKGGV